MRVDDFNYSLPEELIAQTPLLDRQESRLMVLDRKTGMISHSKFSDFPAFIEPGDILVLNDTKVIPARLKGVKSKTGAKIEILLLKEIKQNTWEVLVRPGKRVNNGDDIIFKEGVLSGEIVGRTHFGERLIEFRYSGNFSDILNDIGEMPLPPYITAPLTDKNRYQTVYARQPGSAAAPTAGLHFTPELLKRIEAKGVTIVYITLHVGLGTFRPVKTELLKDHIMHAEYYSVSEHAASVINSAKISRRKIFAVGTTCVRTLESITDVNGVVEPGSGWTDIFIYPGYKFRLIDAMITNFHLPKSTLIMLVSAFADRDTIIAAYNVAVSEKYRFFSFGDAMLIL
jgi:S-adenosylmethionine:tRNA ribosyltransferase-isomerase